MRRLYFSLGKNKFWEYVLLALFLLFFYGPLMNMLLLSFAGDYEYPDVIPRSYGFKWWDYVLSKAQLVQSIGTSLVLAVVVTLLSLAVCLPAAYALARYPFRGRSAVRLSFLLTNAFPKMGMANQKKHRWLPYLMVLPAFSIMVLVVVFPIVNTVARSFRTTDGQFTLDNYVYFFTSAEALQSLLFTLAEALTVMALSVVLSFLLALYLRFSKSPVSRALGKLYLLPRFIPGIAAVYAVMNVIKDSGGINRIAAAFGVDYKPGLLYDLKGIILSNLWFCIPFAAMMMSAALSSVNDSYVESARDAGCSWRDVLCRIILPLTYKDVIVSATFILMGQVGAFTIPYLTGPNNPKMLGILLYQQTGTYMNYERAAALSVLMFLICLGGAIVYIRSNMKEEVWETGK